MLDTGRGGPQGRAFGNLCSSGQLRLSVRSVTVPDVGKRARQRRRNHARRTRPQPAQQPTRQPALSGGPQSTTSTSGPDELVRLDELVRARRQVEEQIAAQVDDLAAAGTSWPVIAEVLGVSRQAARQAHYRRHSASSSTREETGVNVQRE